MPVSATDIRARVAAGQDITDLVRPPLHAILPNITFTRPH